MKYSRTWSSHLPVLAKVLRLTNGSVLELGIGLHSTPFLHWMCTLEKRPLISYDSSSYFHKIFKTYERGLHQVHLVSDWDKIDIEKPWDVAFIDHETERRRVEIKRLVNHAKYIVVHDTQPRAEEAYKYNEIYPLFKYRQDFTFSKAWTTILSNFKDIGDSND